MPDTPAAPTNVTGTRGNGTVLVTFTPPDDEGATEISLYTVTCSNDTVKTGQNSPILVDGLTNGTAYTFTVHATNEAGDSPESSPSAPITPATVPSAPIIVGATVDDGCSTVSFQPPPADGGAEIIDYKVRALDTIIESNGGQWTIGTSSPLVVENLINGDAYTFAVTARNAVGESEPSASTALVIPVEGPADAPPPPLQNAAEFPTNKRFNSVQLQDELEAAVHTPVNISWTRTNGMDPTDNHGILYVVPSDLNPEVVQAVIDNHEIDPTYGIPASTLAYNALVKKVYENTEVVLTEQEMQDAVKGIILRMNTAGLNS